MNPIKILLIEDNPPISTLLGTIFEQQGWSVLSESDGARGLALARKEIPDILVLDVMLPTMDGFDVCRALKADPATAKISVIMLTALNREVDIETAKSIGAVDYFMKPFDPRRIVQRILEVAGR